MKNNFQIIDDYVSIEVNRVNGDVKYAKVSLSDLDKLMQLNCKWFLAKRPHCEGYLAANIKHENGKWSPILLHRYLFDFPTGKMIDHINHNTLDNRRENLRVVTNSENSQNRDPKTIKSKSGIRGVTYDKQTGKWRVRFTKDGKTVHLGRFSSIKEAEKVATEALPIIFPFAN